MKSWLLIGCLAAACISSFALSAADEEQLRDERDRIQAEAKAAERRDFRNAIVSQLWGLAKEKYKGDQSMLFSIKEELWKMDGLNQRMERAIKENGRSNGTMEGQFKELYQTFIRSHDIIGAQDISKHDFTQAYEHKYRNKNRYSWISDEKLSNLWAKVQEMPFTTEEKALLRDEFEHYQEKLHELNELVATDPAMKLLASIPFNDLLMSQNPLIDFPELANMGLSEQQARMLIMHFAELHFTVMNGGERLQLLQQADRQFTQPAVAQLWREAQNQNFAVDELDTIKLELLALEDKINEKEKFERELQKTLRMLDQEAAFKFLDGNKDNHLGLIGAIQTKIQDLHMKLGLKVHGGEL